jgi:hypothetical protein
LNGKTDLTGKTGLTGTTVFTDKKELRQLILSVRELVEFSARSGDLLSESRGGPTALEGIRGHQQVQQQRYRQLMPVAWQLQGCHSPIELMQSIKHFWAA